MGTSVVVYADLLGKEPHRQVSGGPIVTSGSLGDEMVNPLIQNARDLGSIPALCAIFPTFITPTHIYIYIYMYA